MMTRSVFKVSFRWLVAAFGLFSTAQLQAESTLVFPQFVDGDGNRTRIILRNNDSVADSGTINFRDASGDPVNVTIGGVTSNSVAYGLELFSSLDIVTSGDGALKVGSIEICSDREAASKLEGTVVFELLGFKTSVPSAEVRATNQIYVSRTPDENTGMAIFNPNASETATLQIRLNTSAGELAGFKEDFQVGPREQVALFVDDDRLFGDVVQSTTALRGPVSDFKGTMNVFSDSGDEVAILGLIQNSDGSLTSTSTSATGDFSAPPPVDPPVDPPGLTASLCGCTAMVDPGDSRRVIYGYGLQGEGAAALSGNNTLRAALFNDDTFIIQTSGLLNEPIFPCGGRTGLSVSGDPIENGSANIVELRMVSTDGMVTVESCRVNFRE